MEIADLLILTKEKGASDLHLTVGVPPMIRLHGDLKKVDAPVLTKDRVHQMIYDILNDEQRKKFEEDRDLDFSVDLEGVARFRVNTYFQRRGQGAAFRLIPHIISSIEELGLPPVIAHLARKEKGLIIVTGPTGSGKSTTLAAMLNVINKERYGHILTIEDPIEFVHEHGTCIVNQREVKVHTKSFASALRAALREDPDIILVGEMRDLETISLAITAAETGHLVLATLHTMSAPKTVDRIINVFPSDQQEQIRIQISESIQGVVSQALIPTFDGKGRVPAVEIMVAVPAVRNLIREAKAYQITTIIQSGREYGMQSMDQSLKDLVMQGKIAKKEALKRVSSDKIFVRS